MSLSKLLLTLKGGFTSGNWGHRGRPGKHGGSSPGAGHSSIGLKPSDTQADRNLRVHLTRMDRVPGKRTKPVEKKEQVKKRELKKDAEPKKEESKQESMKKVTSSDFEEAAVKVDSSKTSTAVLSFCKDMEGFEDKSGLKIKMTQIKQDGDQYTVKAKILDKDGKEVGGLHREFDFKAKLAYHESFHLDEKQQGSGFGSKLYIHSESKYPSMGINEVTMTANLQVGAYAWARMGYQFASSAERKSFQSDFQTQYKRNFGKEPPFTPKEPYEFASYKGPGGESFGKEFLLGKHSPGQTPYIWEGIKTLSPGNEGYKVGQEYYRSKGIIK